MMKIKAVEMMRKIRDDIDKEYAGVPLKERIQRMKKEIENDPLWQRFAKKHHSVS